MTQKLTQAVSRVEVHEPQDIKFIHCAETRDEGNKDRAEYNEQIQQTTSAPTSQSGTVVILEKLDLIDKYIKQNEEKIKAKDLTLDEALNSFILWIGARYSARTMSAYTGLIKRFIKHVGGERMVSSITIDEVNGYNVGLAKKNYADSSRCYMMLSVRRLFEYLLLIRVIDWDFRAINIPKYENKSYEPVETKFAVKMIEGIMEDNFKNVRNKAILCYLYAIGARVSELCNLRVENLRMDGGCAVITSSKNKIRRMLPWDDRTQKIFKKYLEIRKELANSDYLFISTISCEKI